MDEPFFIATAPAGVEPLLTAELTGLGAAETRSICGGIRFRGTAGTRLSRLSVVTDRQPGAAGAGRNRRHRRRRTLQRRSCTAWEEHADPDGSLAVDFSGTCVGIDHSHYGAQQIRTPSWIGFGRVAADDRASTGCGRTCASGSGPRRSSPDRPRPVRRQPAPARLSYGHGGGTAEETLAAALLLKAGWPVIAATGGPLLDPLCGSGTLAIEAAWIAGDRAPGLLREHWGFSGWLGHVPALWNRLLAEARQRWEIGLNRIPPILASDHDPKAVRAALINAGHAGVANRIDIERRELADIEPPDGPSGLLISNPPYGERLG